MGGGSMDRDNRVGVLEPQRFDVELQSSSPFLVAFLKRNERFWKQTNVLNGACVELGHQLHCFVYDSDYLDIAMERFKVEGTPTFLLFAGGREINRLIGETDSESLEEFVQKSLDGMRAGK